MQNKKLRPLKNNMDLFSKRKQPFAEGEGLFQIKNLEDALKLIFELDPLIHQHCIRTGRIAKNIATSLNLPKEEISMLEMAAVLHDIGKLALTPTDVEEAKSPFFYNADYIREHTTKGAEILKQAHFPQNVVEAVLHHHEWFNGKGLPDHIKGEAIPLFSRIIYVAELYDALMDPHRERTTTNGIHKKKVLEEIKSYSGERFDPKVVEALIKAEIS